MRIVAIDTETHLIQPGLVVPPLVVLSYATDDGQSGLISRHDAHEAFREILSDPDVLIVGHNIAYDMAVLANGHTDLLLLVFQAYAADRVHDTKIMDQLVHIRIGTLSQTKFHLANLAQRYLGQAMVKDDTTWRLRYRELEDIPLDKWPQEAIDYSELDAVNTLKVYLAMVERFGGYPSDVELSRQCRADFALHLMRANGVVADPRAVEALRKQTDDQINQYTDLLTRAGILVSKTKKILGIPVTKDSVNQKIVRGLVTKWYTAQGRPVPMTGPSARYPQGQVCIDRACLEATDSPELLALANRGKATKVRDFVGVLAKAVTHPFNPRWNVLVSTGRTSCGGDEDPGNLQNQPRKGGVRECFVPARGNVFITSDYDCAELRGLAQVCYTLFGFSAMRDVFLSAHDDPHQALADSFPDIVPSRQFAKIPNFGFPGGLGAETFIEFAKGYGCDGHDKPLVTVAQAKALKRSWLNMWPEMVPYFAHITQATGGFSSGKIEQLYSGRLRGGLSFCSGANTYFQGLVADGAKCALFQVTHECFCETASALYGYRPAAFVHDEIIIEGTADPTRASLAAKRLSQVMIEEMQKWMPDLPIKSTAAMMARWYKGAKPTFSPAGLLIPWTPDPK